MASNMWRALLLLYGTPNSASCRSINPGCGLSALVSVSRSIKKPITSSDTAWQYTVLTAADTCQTAVASQQRTSLSGRTLLYMSLSLRCRYFCVKSEWEENIPCELRSVVFVSGFHLAVHDLCRSDCFSLLVLTAYNDKNQIVKFMFHQHYIWCVQ